MPPSRRSPQPIKALLVLRDREQGDVAREVGCSAHYFSQLCNGRIKPSARMVERISAILGVAPDQLFAADDDTVVLFVKRTTRASNVSERVEDPAVADAVAGVLRQTAP